MATTTKTKDSAAPENISDSATRRSVLRQAENMLDLEPASKYHQTIKNLILELSLLDGLYELLSREHVQLQDELQRVKDIIGEDLPHWYLTHRLYALVYPQELIEEMLGDQS